MSIVAPPPYLGSGVNGTPLFRELVSDSPARVTNYGHYPGNPVTTQTFHSYFNTRRPEGGCQSSPAGLTLLAGPLMTFDLSPFVAPFSVQ